MKKRIKLILTLLFAVFAMVNVANADTKKLTKGSAIWYSRSGYIVYHYLDGEEAYCLQFPYSTYAGVTYTEYTGMKESDKYLCGQVIQYFKNKSDFTADQKHLYTVETLNTIMRQNYGLAGSYSFGNSIVKDAIAYAKNKVSELEICSGTNNNNCLGNKNFNLNVDGSTSFKLYGKITNHTYYSNKITLSGLLKSYGGTGTSYTLTLSNGSNICFASKIGGACLENGDKGNGVSINGNKITFTNPTVTSYSFYLRSTGEPNEGTKSGEKIPTKNYMTQMEQQYIPPHSHSLYIKMPNHDYFDGKIDVKDIFLLLGR